MVGPFGNVRNHTVPPPKREVLDFLKRPERGQYLCHTSAKSALTSQLEDATGWRSSYAIISRNRRGEIFIVFTPELERISGLVSSYVFCWSNFGTINAIIDVSVVIKPTK